MLQSVNVKRTTPSKASLWSMIENCKNHDDIKLLFDVLQNIRRFQSLPRSYQGMCSCGGAIDFGKKALWQHNVCRLTPSIASDIIYCHMLRFIMMLNSWWR